MLGHGTSEREYIRYTAASNALDMVRRLISGLPQTDGAEQVPVETSKLTPRSEAL
jgi:nicotinamide-nucleotide amidase